MVSGKAETQIFTGIFLASGWSDGTQTLTIDGILETDNPFVDIELSDVTSGSDVIDAWGLVGRVSATADNTIVGYCYEDIPEVDVPIILKVVR